MCIRDRLYIDPGTPVAVEAPSYLAALQSFRLFGARFEELPLAAHGIDPDQLRHVIRRQRPALVYLIPTFQNPAGVCYEDVYKRQQYGHPRTIGKKIGGFLITQV